MLGAVISETNSARPETFMVSAKYAGTLMLKRKSEAPLLPSNGVFAEVVLSPRTC